MRSTSASRAARSWSRRWRAATATAWPSSMHGPITRADANAIGSAERQRPATSRLSNAARHQAAVRNRVPGAGLEEAPQRLTAGDVLLDRPRRAADAVLEVDGSRARRPPSSVYSPTTLCVSRTPSRNALSATKASAKPGMRRRRKSASFARPADALRVPPRSARPRRCRPSGRPSSAIRESATSTSPGRPLGNQVAALARQALALEVIGRAAVAGRAALRAQRARSTCCIVNIIDGYWIASPTVSRSRRGAPAPASPVAST